MRYWAAFIFFLVANISLGQHKLPEYPSIVEEFYNNYSFGTDKPLESLGFAKKQKGWYTQIVEVTTERVLSEQLFWSAADGKYLVLTGFDSPINDSLRDAAVEHFINDASTYRFYGYDRSRYYGYGRWTEDMIMDFGNGNCEQYSDTLLDGLARAYSGYSSKFFWYQYGGQEDTDDPLKRKLAPLELPSRQRVDSVDKYIRKSVSIYRKLAEKYPAYQTRVGNSHMKLFNEQMNGYMHMLLAGYYDYAKLFLDDIVPDSALTTIAHNYLSLCKPNSILITYGDNDTYATWYVQQKHNYREDVTVLNVQLLGSIAFLQHMKRKQVVEFSSEAKHYGDSYYYYYKADEPLIDSVDLPTFIDEIQKKKQVTQTYDGRLISEYPYNRIVWELDSKKLSLISRQINLLPKFEFVLSNYLGVNEFILLDIIFSNFYTRPIYFTYKEPFFQNNLQGLGLIYQLLPLNTQETIGKDYYQFESQRDFLKYVHQPKFPAGSLIDDGDMLHQNNYQLYAEVMGVDPRIDSVEYYLGKLIGIYGSELPVTLNAGLVAYEMLNTKYKEIGIRLAERYVEFLYGLYIHPSANYFYMSRKTAKSYIDAEWQALQSMNIHSKKIEEIVKLLD